MSSSSSPPAPPPPAAAAAGTAGTAGTGGPTPLQRFRRAGWLVVDMLRFTKRRDADFYLQQTHAEPVIVSEEGKMEQVGGHASAFIKLAGGRVAKVGDPREMKIYPLLREHLPPQMIPQFYEIYHDDAANCDRIVIEDLTAGCDKPCIMDIKMGKKTFESKAPFLKRIKQSTKDHRSSSSHFGVRLVGLKVWRESAGCYCRVTKKEAKTANDPQAFLGWYLHNGKAVNSHIVPELLRQLSRMIDYFRTQKIFSFVGSSLLCIYDGSNPTNSPKLRMIDFAHTTYLSTPSEQRVDEGYLLGLETLRSALQPFAKSEFIFRNPFPTNPQQHITGFFRHMDSGLAMAVKGTKSGSRLWLTSDVPDPATMLFEWVPFVGKIKRISTDGSSREHSTILRTGWLLKEGKIRHAMKERWFVLRGGSLCYYKAECSAMPIHTILLKGATVGETKRERPGLHAFRISLADGGKYILAAPTEKEKLNWRDGIALAISNPTPPPPVVSSISPLTQGPSSPFSFVGMAMENMVLQFAGTGIAREASGAVVQRNDRADAGGGGGDENDDVVAGGISIRTRSDLPKTEPSTPATPPVVASAEQQPVSAAESTSVSVSRNSSSNVGAGGSSGGTTTANTTTTRKSLEIAVPDAREHGGGGGGDAAASSSGVDHGATPTPGDVEGEVVAAPMLRLSRKQMQREQGVKMLGGIRHVQTGMYVSLISSWEMFSTAKHVGIMDAKLSPSIIFEMVTGEGGGGWGRPEQMCGHIEHLGSGCLVGPENGLGGVGECLVLGSEGRGQSRLVFQFGPHILAEGGCGDH